MRSEKEMMNLILLFAKEDERIRVVGMNGSRVNQNVPRDDFQDYDIVYVVTDMLSFIEDDKWIDYFGERIILQKPEAMSLYPAELGNWFSYLMLLEDDIRLDLMLIPLEELDFYLNDDSLTEILLDKDQRVNQTLSPSDRDYHVKKPSNTCFDDCCNEFWWVCTYVAKGLCRNELIYANDHFEKIVREELLRMLAWKVGIETNFSVSVGKSYKYLVEFVDEKVWEQIISTYKLDTIAACWQSLFTAQQLFRVLSSNVAKQHGYAYPEYDEMVSKYIKKLYQNHS
ncbi:aminoglycoside 6-adenylyltransferase [Gracilibacillus sp. YIM 98692]|uniref:aminoglycoside 6-adenylyltransferase n=1 Tax=Gracilibacillus sp. YIM 98692 TaxID=2663532 RepID=UPI0013D43675|nr:aminoglycoside 6-adenylyltransferase [Gracilibacillus sp. YIM 98692]